MWGGVFLYLKVAFAKFPCISLDDGLSRPNFRLFRSTFPEANRQMLRYFLKMRSRSAFVCLLAAWHLDLPARVLVWGYRKLAGNRYK